MNRRPYQESEEYRSRLVTAEEAVAKIRSGERVLVGSGCAAPQALLSALVKRAPQLDDVEVVHLLTFGIAPYVEPKHKDSFRHNAFFIGPNVRDAVREGLADYTPVFLSEIPALFHSKQMRLDAVLVMVSPPDARGFVSLGIHPDIALAGIQNARRVIGQVNPQMPRVLGDTFVSITKFDALVEHDAPLREVDPPEPDEIALSIARHVAALVENGSTLQVGYGRIPEAVLGLLSGHADLGVHSEMISDGVMNLIDAGAVTNNRKGIHPGKVVASFAMGTRKLYDYLDDNPFFEFHQTTHVNSPQVIAQNQKMVSIQTALEVDLTGQVCADSIGPDFYSGIGGQVDFIRGAAMSEGGKPIIALPSTAREGTRSRIVPILEGGAGVVTSRGDVHYVVTEYGVAYLHGKTIRQRAMSLIEIAHPKFRTELRDAAASRRYVPVEWELPTEASRYPEEMEERRTFQASDGRKIAVLIRPLRSSDADRLMEFFYSHEPDTVFGRYLFFKKSLHRGEAIRACTLDYTRRFALAAFDDETEKGRMLAVARYEVNDQTQWADTAVVVHEQYRRMGLARHLESQLQVHARRHGILGFYGELDPKNVAIIEMHRKEGHPVILDFESQIYRYVLPFDEPGKGGGSPGGAAGSASGGGSGGASTRGSSGGAFTRGSSGDVGTSGS